MFFLFVLLSFQNFPQTVITQEDYNKLKSADKIYQIDGSDIIVIPEANMNEFLKTYKPKETLKLNKPADITLDGYVTDVLTNEYLNNIKLSAEIYDDATLIGSYGPVWTNSSGYYHFMSITDLSDENISTSNVQIRYDFDKIITRNLDLKTFSIYNIVGELIKIISTSDPEIKLDFNNLSAGRYITVLNMDSKSYTNILLTNGKSILGYFRASEIIKKANCQINKVSAVGAVMEVVDSTNQHHRYYSGVGEFENNNPRRDFTLIPHMNLEFPISDPEYNIIPTIGTIRDLIWYTARVQGEWQNQRFSGAAWPIKLYIDSTNAPTGGVIEARSVIQYFQDSLDIHRDSLIQESPIEIQLTWTNGISAVKIIWADSIALSGAYSGIELIFSGNAEKFIGANIYIDTNKVQEEDIGKCIAMNLQKYSGPGGPNPINDTNYLGYTTPNRIGPRTRPNNDEKKYIKIGRNAKPYYLNRTYP